MNPCPKKAAKNPGFMGLPKILPLEKQGPNKNEATFQLPFVTIRWFYDIVFYPESES